MAVRLNKAIRILNIGLSAAVEFLQSHEELGEVEMSPSYKLNDAQYEALVKAFGNRLQTRKWMRIVVFSENAQKNREVINSLHWNKFKTDTFMFMPDKAILIPKEQAIKKEYYYWTKEDLINKCSEALEGEYVIKDKLSEPSGSFLVAPYVEPTDERESSQRVFKLQHQSELPQPSILGKIDLDAVNQSTRPKRKTKEEKRKERKERIARLQEGHQNIQHQATIKKISLNTIRDIWQRFVDIQEKLIRQRCFPISIIPDSIEVENDKLYVTVDESKNEQQLDSILKDKLGLESYDLDSGYILVDEDKWSSLCEQDLDSIRKSLSECYIELDTTPAINATINYGGGVDRTDQLTTDELRQMESILENGNLIEGSIDDTAAFISKVSVQREDYLRYLFGDHYKTYERKRKEQVKIVEQFEYHNEYVPWEVMKQYSYIGIDCKNYTITFKINNTIANEELKILFFEIYNAKSDSFKFCRTFTKQEPCHKDYVEEVNDNIRAFMDEATIYCSKDDIEIEVLFVYVVSKHQLIRAKLNEVGQYIKNKGEGYSFNEETGAIGIDFNWREQNIEELIAEVEKEVPFIRVNVHDEHRFKCKVNTQLVGYDALKASLEDKYEDISIENDSVYHQIKIRLPYVEKEHYDLKRASLESDLLQLTVSGIDVIFAEKTEGKIRLNVNYNNNSRLEDLEDSITEMRRADFGFMLDGKEVPFGKLLRANYPNLVFDIDVDEEKKDKIIEVFESKAISTIIPILTGDLEKISRLKNTFTMATTGAELVNPNLQRFIFNSDEATKIQDIDLLLRHDGFVYRELCEHLLNSKINESQKIAILKAMYADDLAVIQGPPGTGKSTAIAELIWQLVRKGLEPGNKRERILLTSETNLAVDNAISRIVNNKTNLVKPVRFGGEEKLESEGLQFSIELMKRWVEEGDECLQSTEVDEETDTVVQNNLILKNWLNNISSRSFYRTDQEGNEVITRWRNYLSHPDETLREIVYTRYLENANVIGATCSSIGDKKSGNEDFNGFTQFYHNYCDVFKQKKGRAAIKFTTVIQDESSKATPAELVLPFVYGQRAIVIGDHRQLPPMLDKEEFEDTLDYAYKIASDNDDREEVIKLKSFVNEHFEEMEISHFQRLYENIDSSLKGTFNYQYRMHPDINEVIEQFYREDGGLYCGLTHPKDLGVNDPDMTNPASRYHGIDIPGLINHNTHVLFIETSSPEMMDGTSRVNYGEVDAIDRLLSRFEQSSSFQRYLNKFTKDEDKQIGVISFYGKQIKQLRAVAHRHSSLPIRVSTVDRFQGMERNIVIVSMVRSNIIQSSKNQQPDRKRYPDYGYPIQKSLGFAQSPNRLNVALSRAKRLLIIVGNRELFSTLEIYQRLFLTIDKNKNNKVVNQEMI